MRISNIARKVLRRIYPPRHLFFYLQRIVTTPVARQRLASLLRMYLPKVTDGACISCDTEVDSVAKSGFVMLPGLVNGDEIAEVRSWLLNKRVYDRWNTVGGDFDPHDPPADCHTAPYHDHDVVECPHVLRWANDPRVLSIVGKTLGAKPTLSNLAIWWSYPGHDTPQEAESFHRDLDDLHFLKLFVYLTEVDDGCGPHAFVPGSHRDTRLTKIRRYEDAEVQEVFGQDGIKFFTGESGTAFLENTFGLHKGQLPASGRRLLFQAQYSLHPIGIYSYEPIDRSAEDRLMLDPYINRLFVKR